MSTINQLIYLNNKKKKILRKNLLTNKPQIRGICVKVYTIKPKKPNSAQRKIAKIRFHNKKKQILAYIPGEGHNLQEHSVVLLKGGKIPDLPGVNYTIIRGKYDLKGCINRKNGRSLYGTKNPSKNKIQL
jgi:small subunit ribosomal protein S12